MGKERELEHMIRNNSRGKIMVVCAKQERMGVLYSDEPILDSPKAVLNTFDSLFKNAGVEQCLTVSLTSELEPVAVKLVAVGGVEICYINIAEILKLGLLSNCPNLILLHNHPSGDPEPSKEDFEITKKVKEACDLVGLRLLDHLIVTGNGVGYSLEEKKKVLIRTAAEKKGA